MRLILFLLIFSPKLFGFFDARILCLPIIFSSRNIFNRFYWVPFILLSLLLFQEFILSVIYGLSIDIFFRYIRAIVSLQVIVILFDRYSSEDILKGFRDILMLHAIVVLLQFLSSDMNSIISSIYLSDVDKIRSMRFSGLTAGFDISGFIALFSCILYAIYGKSWNLLYFFIPMVASLLTSRVTIILQIILFPFFIHMIFKYGFHRRFYYLIPVVVVLLFFYSSSFLEYFLGVMSTFDLPGNVEVDADIVANSYSVTDPIDMLRSFLIVPNELSIILFGSNDSPLVDSGYIILLNSTGIVGLLIIILLHFRLYRESIKSVVKAKRLWYGVVLILFLLLNIKNLYFLTRTAFEVYVIFFSIPIFAYKGGSSFVSRAF